MISRTEAFTIILDNTTSRSSLKLPIQQSLGLVLSEPVFSEIELPPFTRSLKDGYAVLPNETRRELDVTAIIRAGDCHDPGILPGQAVKIMTGAPVPTGAGRIVMKEDVTVISEQTIQVNHYHKNNNISYKGEDNAKGIQIYSTGKFITPIIMASIISAGVGQVSVYPRPGIGLAITGDELLDPGAPYQPGKIYNSNGPLLEALLKNLGDYPLEICKIPDQADCMSREIGRLIEHNDITIITGGISVGDFDFTQKAVLANGAELLFKNVKMKPGKPLAFFKKQNKLIFALPGNPVSVFLAFHLFVLPAICRMQGLDRTQKIIKIKMPFNYKVNDSEREQFVPIQMESPDDFDIIKYHGSGHLLALNDCNGFLIVPAGVDKLPKGSLAEVVVL